MELLTIQETARMLRVAPITIRRYIADGRLPAVRVGRGVRLQKEAVDQFVTPVESKKPRRKPRGPVGRPLTDDDPMWQLIGSATSAEPTDSSRIHEYVADAVAVRKQ